MMRAAVLATLLLVTGSGCDQKLGATAATFGFEDDPSCEGACVVGSARCSSDAAVQVCELVAGCGRWGVPVDCEAGCDRATGRCGEQPRTGLGEGARCDTRNTCATGLTCLERQGGLDFGGRCTRDCTRRGTCGAGTRCVDVEPRRSWCLATCDARTGRGCEEGAVCDEAGFCLPRCTEKACALFGHACSEQTGRCEPCGRAGERCCPSASGGEPSCDGLTCVEGLCR